MPFVRYERSSILLQEESFSRQENHTMFVTLSNSTHKDISIWWSESRYELLFVYINNENNTNIIHRNIKKYLYIFLSVNQGIAKKAWSDTW